MTAEPAIPKDRRKIRIGIAVAAISLAVLYTFIREMGVVEAWKLSRTRTQIEGENKALREEIGRLREEVRQLQTNPRYIEEIARKDLGLVGAGENVIFIDRGDRKTPPAAKGGTGRP